MPGSLGAPAGAGGDSYRESATGSLEQTLVSPVTRVAGHWRQASGRLGIVTSAAASLRLCGRGFSIRAPRRRALPRGGQPQYRCVGRSPSAPRAGGRRARRVAGALQAVTAARRRCTDSGRGGARDKNLGPALMPSPSNPAKAPRGDPAAPRLSARALARRGRTIAGLPSRGVWSTPSGPGDVTSLRGPRGRRG